MSLPPVPQTLPGSTTESRPLRAWMDALMRLINGGGGIAPANATYVTVTDESADLANSRRLVAGTNITLTDGGAGSTLTIDASGGGGGTSVFMGVDPPSGTPTAGDLWWNTEEGQLKVYYTDANTSQWVDASKGKKGDTGATGATGPTGSTGPQGDPGEGVAAGGTAGQVLAKIDSTDYNTEWVDQSGGGGDVPPFGPPRTFAVPLASDFGSTYGSGITLTDKTYRLQLQIADGSTIRAIGRTAPSTPYTIDVCAELAGAYPSTGSSTIMYVGCSDGTKFNGMYLGMSAGSASLGVQRWNSTSSYSGDSITATKIAYAPRMYWRMTNDGTTRKFWYSTNGLDYFMAASESPTAFLTESQIVVMFFYSAAGGTQTAKFALYDYQEANSVLGDVA